MICGLILCQGVLMANEVFKRSLTLMGTHFEITVLAANEEKGNVYIDLAVEEIRRIERLISSWDPNSQTSMINANAGKEPIEVSTELFDLIERSLKISRLTTGAFDISYASMDKVWRFEGSMTERPTDQEVLQSVEKVGYENIILDRQNKSVLLKEEGMKIGFGAIGKGYAADKAKSLLVSKRVPGGIINASGDLTAWGTQPDGKPWLVGITNPLNKDKAFSWLPVHDEAVVTSGNYEKYVEFDGKKYFHIIDPRTGYPSTGILSASIFTKKAEVADALATSIFVMGLEVGLDLINQLQGVECIIVDDRNAIHTSANITLNTALE